MTASLETLVVASYLFADEMDNPRPGPKGQITDAELVALAVAQAAMGVPSDRQFLGLVAKVLPGWFPHLPCQSQYNRRLRRLAPLVARVQLQVAELIAQRDLRLTDGTLIGVANYPGCASRSDFAGTASYGYCPSKSQFVWGVRLVLVTDPNGVPVGYTLVAATEKEYEPVRELATAHRGCTLIADKGLWGRQYAETLALQDITLLTPERRRVDKLLPGFFPHLPSQSQYNRRLRALTPKLVWVHQRLSALLESGALRLADGTLLGVANYAGCQHRSEFAGHAAYGYCPSKSRFYWGMRLVLVTDARGLPVGYTLVPANEKEYEPVRELTTSQAGALLIADKSLWGREYAETLRLQGVTIRTPARERTAASERSLAGRRMTVESGR